MKGMFEAEVEGQNNRKTHCGFQTEWPQISKF